VAGATAYVSHFPCINCAKMLAAAGIRVIKYHTDYRNDPLVTDLLSDAGIVISRL
jgi:dCMP deaminase